MRERITGYRVLHASVWQQRGRMVVLAIGCLFSLAQPTLAAGEAGTLASCAATTNVWPADPMYGKRVVIAGQLATSKFLAPAVADLQHYLGAMTGSAFEVAPDSDTAGAGRIHLMLTNAPDTPEAARRALAKKGLEPFVICGGRDHLLIVANDEYGISHGIYYYLEQLGVRWLLPMDNWTVVPKRTDISLSIGRLVEPAYKARLFFGTGGYFSWRWGRRYTGSADREAAVNTWMRRLRYGGEYRLAGSVGEGFMRDKAVQEVLKAHPEYLARVNGAYTPATIANRTGELVPNEHAKVNAGNPDAVALFCNWTISRLTANRKTSERRLHNVFSVEPSDGYGYGDNIAELPGNGSGSDQSFYIANQCARKAAALYPGVTAHLLAYAGHAETPSFALEPNLIVQLAPYAFQTTPPKKFIAEWQKKAPRLTLYDYWSIPDWTSDEPSFDLDTLAERLRYWHASKIEALTSESTYGMGAMGLGHYLAAHLMWNLDADQRALADDWFEQAFGPARMPMQRMIERWSRSFTLTSEEIAASLADVAEAGRLAPPGSPYVSRIDDFAAYVNYLRMRLELVNAPDAAAKQQAAVALMSFVLSIHDRGMVHTTRINDLLARDYSAVWTAFDLSAANPAGPGWAHVTKMTHDDIAALIEKDRQMYPAADWKPGRFTGALKPAAKASTLKSDNAALGPAFPTIGPLTLKLFVPSGGQDLRLLLTRAVDNEIEIHDSAGRKVLAEKIKGGAGTEWQTIPLELPAGEYEIAFSPAGGRNSGYFKFQMSAQARLVMTEFRSSKLAPSPRLFFYVPRGQRHIAMFYPDGDFGGFFKFRLRYPSGEPVQLRYQDNRRVIEADVPAGSDGRIWSIENSVSPNQPHKMLTTPQAFSLSAETAMAPSDAQ